MNKKPAIGFALITAFVVAAAILSVGLRIYLAESAGRRAALDDFQRLEALLAPVGAASDLADQVLRVRLQAHYQRSPNLLFAGIYERSQGQLWRIPARSAYLPEPGSPRGKPKLVYPPRSSLLLSANLPGDAGGNLVLDALYLVLAQNEVFLAFRDAALGLGLYLALSALLFLIAFGGRKPRVEASWTVGGPDAPGQDPGLESEPTRAEREAELDRELLYSEVAEDFDIPALAEEEEPDRIQGKAEPSAGAATAALSAEPRGLFSPLSGLGWESYLLDRLEAELARSASFEQDLSLLLLSYDGLSPELPAYTLLAKNIAEFFSFKDLSFERGPEGFAVILPSIDVEHALRMAEEFLKKLTFLLKGEEHAAPLDYLPLFIGLSSRAGRLVEASRLIHEAEAALGKAREERDTRIVAFRPDPDKYRRFLASKGC